MIDDNFDHGWRQHFPTYNFKDRDIAIEEYKTASKILEAEERIFLNASNIAIIASAGLGSLAVGSLDNLTKQFSNVLPLNFILVVLVFVTAGFSWVALRYFADRQRAIVFAARKVIVLRRMLGLNYGSIQLVLPNWRIEGADEPFAVRLFPGWNTYVTYPYYAISGISSVVLLFLFASVVDHIESINQITKSNTWPYVAFGALLWAFFLAYVYRKALLDIHENMDLVFARILARVFNLKLVNNFEYIIYRATLARYEFVRLRIDQEILKKMLVFIEDRTFFSHCGLSLKAIARAILGFLKIKRRSGGSTITQQLSRSLFVVDQRKLFRRKIIEAILAICFNNIFPKNEQLELYLASVRFERGVYGALDAMTYFWGERTNNVSKAQAFFLIERVSNIYSLLLTDKIIQTLRQAIDAKILDSNDIEELCDLYRQSINDRKIKDPDNELSRIKEFIKNAQPAG